MSFTDDFFKELEKELAKQKKKKGASTANSTRSYDVYNPNEDPHAESIIRSSGERNSYDNDDFTEEFFEELYNYATTYKGDKKAEYDSALGSRKFGSSKPKEEDAPTVGGGSLMKNGFMPPDSDRETSQEERKHGGGGGNWETGERYRSENNGRGGLDIFQKGPFKDGYDFGDVTKAILGTAGDTGLNVVKGFTSIVEGFGDTISYGVADVADWAGEDEWADDMRAEAKKDFWNGILEPADDFLEKYSLFGETTDSIAQGLGQAGTLIGLGGFGAGAGLGTAGTTAITSGTMFTSSYGNGVSEALRSGATVEEARTYGLIAGASDTISEMLWGGLGKGVNAVGISKGLSSIDDVAAKKLSNAFKNEFTKNWSELFVKAGFEGAEEVIAAVGQAAGKSITYMSEEDFWEILEDENLLEQFVVGAVTSGMTQSGYIPGTSQGSLKESNQTGRDFVTGLTANEQAVIDKEVEKRIEEAEKDGTKLSNKDKNKIVEAVKSDLDKGYISTDTIEEVLGGDSYKEYQDTVKSEDSLVEEEKSLRDEYEELGKKTNPSLAEQSRFGKLEQQLDELNTKIEDTKKTSQRDFLQRKYKSEVYEIAKGSRLVESYNEIARRGQAFEADVSKYDEKQRAIVQKAIDSGILNNTNRSHEFVDIVAKIAADKGVSFDFVNNAKLKESGFAVDGKMVNGYVTKDGIAINMDSPKAWQSTVGHEITHVLEGTELYTELQNALFEYAKSKGDYQGRLDTLTKLYEGVEGADINAELTADLVGDYLFQDADFVNNLSTKHRNIFQKIYDEIKYLIKVTTAGTKEARELEKVKHVFEEAYRAQSEAVEQSGVKLSISKTSKMPYGDQLKQIEQGQMNGSNSLFVGTSENLTKAGFTDAPFAMNQSDYRKSRREAAKNSNYSSHAVPYDFFENLPDNLNNAPMLVDNGNKVTVITPYAMKDTKGNNSFVIAGVWQNQQMESDTVNLVKSAYPWDDFADRIKRHAESGELVVTNKKKAEQMLTTIGIQPAEVSRLLNLAKNIISQNSEKSSGSVKNSLSEEQQEYFKDSVVRDENGNLKVMYHGTSKGGFTVFDTYGSNYGLFGQGSYFTDNKDIGESYTGKGRGNNPQVYEAYLNITNPIDMDAEADPAAWQKAFPDASFPESGTNEDFYRAMEDYFEDEGYYKYEAAETAMNALIGMGYDGITHIGGGRVDPDGTRHQVYIAFHPEQIKNIDNVKPTSDADIRYSISEDSDGNALSDGQKEFFKDSKIVDENGNLRVMYHGTPNGEFTIFRDGTYFTANKEYADKYQNPSASSLNSRKVATSPKTFEVYLNITKPFDINDPEARSIYINDYIKGGNAIGINPYLSDAEYDNIRTIDWTEGEDLREFLVENGYDYDGLVLDEGAVGGYGEDVEYRGTSYVVFSPEQVKSVDNQNPTSDPDIRFSLSEADNTYLDAVKRGDTETAQRLVDEVARNSMPNSKVRDENGELYLVYHGSPSKFTVFDHNKLNAHGNAHGRGFYFTEDRSLAEGYEKDGGQLLKGYLNIEKPLSEEKITIKKADLVKLIKATSESEAQLLVSEGGYDNVREAVLDTWVSNYVDTYGTNINAVYREVADIIYSGNENDVDIIAEITNSGAGNEIVLKKTYEVLGYDGVIYTNEMTGKHEYVALVSNQFKSTDPVTYDDNGNVIPLSERFNQEKNDIRYSLSEDGQAPQAYGNFATPARDLRLETAQEDIAPVREPTATTQETPQELFPDDYAPLTEEETAARQSEILDGITDEDAPPEMDAPYYGEEEASSPADPFENRDIKEVGNRKVKAYMYENPEVKPFFQEEANIMLGELNDTVKGERIYTETDLGSVWTGTSRYTSDDIAYLRDSLGYTYAEIEKGLNAIIEDDGAENNAISKRIEFILNDRLADGYTDFRTGMGIPANQEYINLLNEKQITDYSREAWDNFIAEADQYAPSAEDDIAPVRASAPKAEYEAIRPRRQTAAEAIDDDIAPIGENVEYGDKLVRADSPFGKERKWVGTSTESKPVKGKVLPDDLNQETIHYQPISNKTTLGNANARLDKMGFESSVSYFNSQFAGKKVTLDDIALGERLIQEAVKRGDTKTAGELIQNVAILGTELGQKVQALSIIKRLTPEGQLGMLQKVVERGKTKGDKAYDGVELTQEMIDKILAVYGKDGTFDQKKLNEAVEKVKKDIADQMKVTKMDKVNAWRYLSMLGNPKTHIRNLVSNVAMKGTVAVKNVVARTMESVAPIKNRTKTWKAASDDVKAFAKTTTAEMKDVLSDGGKYSEDASIKEKRQIFKNKILNGLYEFNSDLLTKEDWWFSKPAFNNALKEYLTANGIRTAEDIKNNPKLVEKAKLYATEQSQIATFRQYSWLANKINDIERHNTATDIAVGAVLPFKKTPINIAKTGLNYSPLGFVKTLTYDASQVKNGKMEASEMIDHLAQNVTGSALTLIGYLLASAGFISGGGDDDKEGEYDYQLGRQSYAVNIGGKSFSLSWLSPVSMPLFVGANAYEQLVEGKEWNGDVVVETLAQTLDPLSEMSFLSGLNQVLSSYDSGLQKFAGIGESMIQNYATQFVPTLSSQVATVMDDTKRSTKVAADSDFKFFDETINKLKLKIPFLRETLEPTTDIWGNEVKQTDNVLTRAFETFLAPYSKKDNIATEIDAEIKSLYSETGDNGIIPSIPYNYVNYDNVKYEMSGSEYTAYKKTYGQTAYNLLEKLFGTATYQNASSEERAELVNKVYDYARDTAKMGLLSGRGVTFTNATKDGVDYYKENAIKGAIENDMSVDEYSYSRENPEMYEFLKSIDVNYDQYMASDDFTKDAYTWAYKNPSKYTLSKAVASDVVTYRTYANDLYNIKADKDEDGKSISGSRKEKVLDYINNLDADYGEKIILFKSEYPADDTYNYDIIDYLNSRADISYEEMNTILRELGFKIASDGITITWD